MRYALHIWTHPAFHFFSQLIICLEDVIQLHLKAPAHVPTLAHGYMAFGLWNYLWSLFWPLTYLLLNFMPRIHLKASRKLEILKMGTTLKVEVQP